MAFPLSISHTRAPYRITPARDDNTTNDLEDDFALSPNALAHGEGVPGCVIADSDTAAYVGWHITPGNLKLNGQPCILAGHEDDEEDDVLEEDDDAGQIDEDGVNTAFDQICYQYGSSGPAAYWQIPI